MENGSIEAAIERASAGYSAREWAELPPKTRTAAVYTALRQLDTEAVTVSRHGLPEQRSNSPPVHAGSLVTSMTLPTSRRR
jgi:hypothetical protein